MPKENLDDTVDQVISDESASAEAIRSLIKVEKTQKGDDTEIELKTELSDDEVKIHSIIDIFGRVLESNEKTFGSKSIFPMIVEKLERKALSKRRKSREEIVAVARQPDMNQNEFNVGNESAFKRFFMGRRRPE